MKGVKILVDGRVVGTVSGRFFYKQVDSTKHFLRKPRAICLDVQSIKDAEEAGALFVKVTDKVTNATYQSSIKNIRENGFQINRRFGLQIALTFKHWNKPGDDGKPKPIQLTLF